MSFKIYMLRYISSIKECIYMMLRGYKMFAPGTATSPSPQLQRHSLEPCASERCSSGARMASGMATAAICSGGVVSMYTESCAHTLVLTAYCTYSPTPI